MFDGLRKIWNPGMYQGSRRMRRYFEGWYYKLVDAGETEIIAVIPGVSFDITGQKSTAFIQLLDTTGGSSTYFTCDIGDFQYSSREFEIQIGPNSFSAGKLSVNCTDGTNSVKGILSFQDLTPWPATLFSPGAMGWYRFVPFMECYHAVLSFDHAIEGTLIVNGRNIDFTGGRGYIEKDWGMSFPQYHVWLQTNHFDTPGTSLMVSIANIPWLGSYFDGFIAGFRHNGVLYTFATHTGAKLTLFRLGQETVTIHISSRQYRLEIEVSQLQGLTLRAPVLGAMKGRLQESQRAKTSVRLFFLEKRQESLVFEGTGRNTGLEVAGNREALAAIKVYEKS